AFVDTMAVAYAAAREEGVTLLRESMLPQLGTGNSVTVTGDRASLVDAAMINATAAHVLDYDDTADGIKGHPSAVLVPAILAVGAEAGASGRAMIEAFCVGFHVAMSVGAGLDIKPHYEHGW